ncbi:MAG: nucleotide exchange factor GrpE [Thermoguttaceae bacterium]
MDRWPDQEEILARFRGWLDRTRAECDGLEETPGDEGGEGDSVGLYELVEQLTALRHDVKLLTKAARGMDEGTEATRLSLQAAIEQFRSVGTNEEAAADKAARPLVEAMVDLDEALIRCRRAIAQAGSRVAEDLNAELREAGERLDALFRAQPWWRKMLCRPWHEAARSVYSGRALDTCRAIFGSLLEGYDLIDKRLHRLMDEQSIVQIPCLGQPADPKRMTVVEVVSDASRPPGTVIEEIRPGYCWKGRIVRFAEVKAVGEH